MSHIESRRVPVYFLKDNPGNWVRSMQPEITKQVALLGSKVSPNFEHRAKEQQNARWTARTGQKPEDSYFSVIVPIHDEKETLASTLGTLITSDVPADANARFVFVTNGCTDEGASAAIVRNFMQGLGEVKELPIHDVPIQATEGLAPVYTTTKVGNVEFMHIDTAKRGKANALNIGNDIARGHGTIAMCLDADVYAEPETIPSLYAAAQKEINGEPGTPGIVSGLPTYVFSKYDDRKSKMLGFFRKTRFEDVSRGHVSGQVFAWDTEMVHQSGGIPQVAIEDYATGVIARQQGRTIAYAQEANVWSYKSSGVRNFVRERARYARGALQIIAQHPESEATVRQENLQVTGAKERAKHLLKRVKKSPIKAPFYVASYGLNELGTLKGQYDFRKDPDNQSWKRVRSKIA